MINGKTYKKGIRWAKVSGQRGSWTIAQGWKGQIEARYIQKANTKLLAECIAEGWLND